MITEAVSACFYGRADMPQSAKSFSEILPIGMKDSGEFR